MNIFMLYNSVYDKQVLCTEITDVKIFRGYFVKQDHDRGIHIPTFSKPTIDIQIANDHLSFNVINLRYVPYSIINEIEVVYVTQWVLMLLWTFSFMKVSDDVQHKYNSMTKEKGAEYKKIFLLSMNEWNEPGQILVLAYENMNKKYSRTMRNRKHTCPSIWTLSSVQVFSLCTHTDKCTEARTGLLGQLLSSLSTCNRIISGFRSMVFMCKLRILPAII